MSSHTHGLFNSFHRLTLMKIVQVIAKVAPAPAFAAHLKTRASWNCQGLV